MTGYITKELDYPLIEDLIAITSMHRDIQMPDEPYKSDHIRSQARVYCAGKAPQLYCMLAYMPGHPVPAGYIVGTVGSLWTHPTNYANIEFLFVAPHARHKGLAVDLINMFEHWAISEYSVSRITAGTISRGMTAFCKRLKYQPIGTIMEKRL